MKKELKIFTFILASFLLFYFMPMESAVFTGAILSGFQLMNEYAREHVLTCLVPAFFIAGAIAVFIKKDSVIKYLGQDAKKYISYGVASVSGAILAVCSCTILPLFAGIRKRGAGLGPAITFLFSGPAINIAAMTLTISVLGPNIGFARIISAITISILVGITMAVIFREKVDKADFLFSKNENSKISKATMATFFILMVGFLIINDFSLTTLQKYSIMGVLLIGIISVVILKFEKSVTQKWLSETWGFSKKLIPLLFIGVFIAGFIMPLLPQTLIEKIVGTNSITGNLTASIFGAFMYFSTLTEVPVLQALMAKGMHNGPALALLLAGPSLSLPNMLVIKSVLGDKKTAVYISLVIIYSTIAGLIFGGI
ncbi:MAG: permease [Candidatus Gracilibacteria bacterium]|nr:permease [Candidatus Gracilibacteria bacterium]